MPRSAGGTRRSSPPKAELTAEGGLDAIAVEDFALDFRGLQGLIADELNLEGVLVIRADMLERAEKLAGIAQELPSSGSMRAASYVKPGHLACCQFHFMSYSGSLL